MKLVIYLFKGIKTTGQVFRQINKPDEIWQSNEGPPN